MLNTTKYITPVPFSGLFNWSVQYLNDSKIAFNKKYPMMRIGDFLTRNKTAVIIEDDKTYKRATIKVRNGGVFLRDEMKGKSIGTKNQFLIYKGQFLLSKIDARNGAFGVVPDILDGGVITGNFWTFDVNNNIINPHYLTLLTTTSAFISFCEQASNGTTNRHYLQELLFLNIKVPVPSLEVQNKLVEKFDAMMGEIQEIDNKIHYIQHEIQNYLLNSIGITPSNLTCDDIMRKNNSQYSLLKFIDFSDISRWDTWDKEYYVSSALKLAKYPIAKLDTYEFVHRKWECEGAIFRYIELGSVEPMYGIVRSETLKTDKAPSRATQIIKEGDLIIGTTRPYLKKFAIVSSQYNNCVCSSGFQVIRANKNYNLNYLYEYLHTDLAIKQMEFYMTGALYPAITSKDLKKILVPLPPINIQNEIVQHIEELKIEINQLIRLAEVKQVEAKKAFETQIFEYYGKEKD